MARTVVDFRKFDDVDTKVFLHQGDGYYPGYASIIFGSLDDPNNVTIRMTREQYQALMDAQSNPI